MDAMNSKLQLSEYGFNILQIETNANCNMACSFCPHSLRKDNKTELDIDAINQIIESVDPEHVKYLTFSQFNETLMDRRIFDVIKAAKSKGFKVLLVSNGLLLNKDEIVRSIIDAQPDFMKISLQVLDAKSFDRARGITMEVTRYTDLLNQFLAKVEGSDIDVVMDIGCNFLDNSLKTNVKRLFGWSLGDPAVASTIREVYGYLNVLLDDWRDEKHSFHPQVDQGELKRVILSSSPEYVSETGLSIASNIKIKIKPFIYGRRIAEFHPTTGFACSNPILGILADGNVVPCCLAYDSDIALGNVKDKPLRQVLEDGKAFLDNLRRKDGAKAMTCRKCMGEPTRRGAFIRSLVNRIR